MKTKKGFLLISMLYTAFFIPFFIIKYGWLDSISESAKYLTPDGLQFLFFMFIYLMCGSVIWASQSWLGTFAGVCLLIIGTITGFNPDIPNPGFQHTIHVIVTILAIVLIMIDILVQSVRNFITDIGFPLFIAFALFTGIAYFSHITHSVFWIEVVCFTVVYTFYLKLINIKRL